jgi:hypothetical protein
MSNDKSRPDHRREPLKGPIVPCSPIHRMLEMAARAVAFGVRQKTDDSPIALSSPEKDDCQKLSEVRKS